MDKFEIRKRIDANDKKIQELLRPDIFVLNKEVKALLDENKELQKQCPHEFVKGICVYCDLEENK